MIYKYEEEVWSTGEGCEAQLIQFCKKSNNAKTINKKRDTVDSILETFPSMAQKVALGKNQNVTKNNIFIGPESNHNFWDLIDVTLADEDAH